MNNDFDMNKIEITEFNPVKCSREDWQQYHDYRRIRHEERNPDDPLTPDEMVEYEINKYIGRMESNYE